MWLANNQVLHYRNSLKTIIYFGLLVFFGGIYIYPENSGTQQTFYLLVALPFLLLFPTCPLEFPWRDKLLYLFLAFPVYMLASHFWAPEGNIGRGPLYFVKQIVFYVIFLLSVYLTLKERPRFLRHLLYFLFAAGFASAIISIIHHALIDDNYLEKPLMGFSIVDIDKAGSIYTLHYGFSLYLLFDWRGKTGSVWCRLLFITAALIDLVAVYLTQTVGTWIVVVLFPCLLISVFWAHKRVLLTFAISILAMVVGVILYFFHPDILAFAGVEVRIDLGREVLRQIENHYFFGIGLTYKSPMQVNGNSVIPHPHNIFLDTLRFGGIVGLALFALQILSPCVKLWPPSRRRPLELFLLNWLVCGLLLAGIYGQQPYVRPGSYMWFFYWMPLVLLFAKTLIRKRSESESARVGQTDGAVTKATSANI